MCYLLIRFCYILLITCSTDSPNVLEVAIKIQYYNKRVVFL